jgi:hypothetical protein
MNLTALSVVEGHLASCLPEGVPPVHRQVVSAERLHHRADKSTYRAELRMFDGLPATVEVSVAGEDSIRSESHRWLSMEGGAASFENERWQRVWEAA